MNNSASLKNYHLFLSSLYGCFLIYGVLGVYFLLNSQDEAIFSGHLWSKIVANAFTPIPKKKSLKKMVNRSKLVLII